MKLHRTIVAAILLAILITLPYGAGGTGRAIEEFLSQEGKDWRIHWFGDGRVRSLYGSGKTRNIADADSAKAFFADYSDMFGIKDVGQLHLSEVERDESGA